jgi:hypothetical protein
MGMAMELLSGRVTAPDTTLTAWTLAAGSSLTIRNARPGSIIWLLNMWADNQAAGVLRVRSPFLHDNVQGIRQRVQAGVVEPLLPWGARQRLIPQDTLTAEQSGSATAGDIESGALLVWYDDLPGIDGRFITVQDLMQRTEQVLTVENTLALGTTGGFSGEEAINAEFDEFKNNRDYAIMGFTVSAEATAIRWRGSDTGNLGVGGPAEPGMQHVTIDWFVRLSEVYGRPMVPVFNASNKDGLLIDAVQDENGTDVTVVTQLALLT